MDSLDKRDGGERAGEVARALDQMWAKFLPDIRERVSVLEAAAQAVQSGALSEEQRAAAHAAAHKLAGTLGTFGLDRGTALARGVEQTYAQKKIAPAGAAALRSTVREIRAMIESRK